MINNFPLALHNDLLIHSAYQFPNTFAIRRRDQQGYYQLVSNVTTNSFNPVTNGKYVLAWNEGNIIWELKDNSLLDSGTIADTISSAKIFEDDTIVVLDSDANLVSYQLVNGTWSIVQVSDYPNVDPLPLTFPPTINLAAPFHGNYFIAFSQYLSNIRILERQADLSWQLIETIAWTNFSTNAVGVYNGNDTVAVGYSLADAPAGTGYLVIFTKVNGDWQQRNYQGADLGIDPLGSFGTSVAFSDQNTLWISAPTNGQSTDSSRSGKIYMLTRTSSGVWEPMSEFNSNDNVKFGMGVNFVDDYLVTIGCNNQSAECNLYSVPLCILEPVNITCHDQQAKSCVDVDPNSLFTIDNSNCESVPITVSHVTVDTDKGVTVEFTFSRSGYNTTCMSVVSCTRPPSANTPRTSNASLIAGSLTLIALLVAMVF